MSLSHTAWSITTPSVIDQCLAWLESHSSRGGWWTGGGYWPDSFKRLPLGRSNQVKVRNESTRWLHNNTKLSYVDASVMSHVLHIYNLDEMEQWCSLVLSWRQWGRRCRCCSLRATITDRVRRRSSEGRSGLEVVVLGFEEFEEVQRADLQM